MQIIQRPCITEKTLALAAKGYYTFVVGIKSNKGQIATAISTQYNVNVITISTITMHGKIHRAGKKMKMSVKPNWKKAVVRLASGQKIDVFDVSHEGEKQS